MSEDIRLDRERSRWDDECEVYDDFHVKNFSHVNQQVLERTVEALKSSDQVVDLGCGTGIFTLGVAPHIKSIKGYDISEKMLSIAIGKATSEGISNASFHSGDVYYVPETSNSFDAVLCCHVLDVVERPEALLREAHRLLKPGGPLLCVTDCYQDSSPPPYYRLAAREARRLGKEVLRKSGILRSAEQFPKDTDIIRLLNRSGFRINEIQIIDIGSEMRQQICSPNQFSMYVQATPY